MAVLVNSGTRLLTQGITGSAGSFHSSQCRAYGTNLVAGVTPGKGGTSFEGAVPIFNTVAEAVAETGANASMIFVPPPLRRRRHLRGRRRGRGADRRHHRGHPGQ